MALAPGGGPDFPEESIYVALQEDCRLTRVDDHYFTVLKAHERRLYEGAAAACRAAFHGEPEKWQVAEAALAQIDATDADFTCLGDVVYEALRDAVAVHTAEPTAPLVKGGGPGRVPACPRVISIEPDRGPAAGDYPVQLTGENLPARSVIHFGDVEMTVQTDGESASLIVPPAPEDAEWSAGEYSIAVWVEGWYKDHFDQAGFVYELPTQPSGSRGTEEGPTASPGTEASPTMSPGG